MKYLITESQFDKVIFNFLDNQKLVKVKKGKDLFFAYTPDDNSGVIKYNKHRLIVNKDLTFEVMSFFSIDQDDAEIVIRDWVSKEINKKIDVWEVTSLSGLMADANLSM